MGRNVLSFIGRFAKLWKSVIVLVIKSILTGDSDIYISTFFINLSLNSAEPHSLSVIAQHGLYPLEEEEEQRALF